MVALCGVLLQSGGGWKGKTSTSGGTTQNIVRAVTPSTTREVTDFPQVG